MRQLRLGNEGLIVSAQGLGCMGMSFAYGGGDDQESVATIQRALDLGVTGIQSPQAPAFTSGVGDPAACPARVAGRQDGRR